MPRPHILPHPTPRYDNTSAQFPLGNSLFATKEKLQKNLEDYSQARAISTASRLVEMGLLEKGSSKNETAKLPPRTTYSITSFGKEIYEEILSKNS